jgi:hypothetical protein
MIRLVLEEIYKNPDLLKRSVDEKQGFLQKQGNQTAQGSGNKVTTHEACFADVLESNGFKFITKKETCEDSYYKYQPNGTQKSPDFEVYDKDLKKTLNFDLKHTNSKSFYFNDGWFEKGVIYVISWCSKKTNKVLIGYGDHIPSEEENTEMINFIQFKKNCNKQNKKVGSLRKCIRFANQYSCDTFTDEFSTEKLNLVLASLTL